MFWLIDEAMNDLSVDMLRILQIFYRLRMWTEVAQAFVYQFDLEAYVAGCSEPVIYESCPKMSFVMLLQKT